MYIIMIFIALLLTSCGQMGDLYLPKQNKTKATDHVAAPVHNNSENSIFTTASNTKKAAVGTSASETSAQTETTRYHQEQFDQDDKEQHTNN